MYQSALKFIVISLCLINELFVNILNINGEVTVQDWSMLLRKPFDEESIEERADLQTTEDPVVAVEDANNPCPMSNRGEQAPQPWDVNFAHDHIRPFHVNSQNNNNKFIGQGYGQIPSTTNCQDESSDVVIKILFNRDDPCDKNKDKINTLVQFDPNSKYKISNKPDVEVNISNPRKNK